MLFGAYYQLCNNLNVTFAQLLTILFMRMDPKIFTVVPLGTYSNVQIRFELMACLDNQMFHFQLSKKKFLEKLSTDMYQVQVGCLKDDSREYLEIFFTLIPNCSEPFKMGYEK